jgi:phosphatidylglycerophosphatase A
MRKNFLYKLICTASGLGLLPRAPGTFGALGGLAVGFSVMQFTATPNFILFILIVLFFVTGAYCAEKLIQEWGKDPSVIVIDEVVGMWVSMLFIPNNIFLILLAFVIFRFFDIAKPLFIRKMENIRGGWGIMLDDVVAGIFANAVVQLLIFLIEIIK